MLAVLDDDLRRRTFLFVLAKGLPVSREQVAEEVGVSASWPPFTWTSLLKRAYSTTTTPLLWQVVLT